jgi:hypothetical protein
MERTLDLNYDELVIGADLSALSYAYSKKIPIIFTRKIMPHQYNLEDNFEKATKKYVELIHKLGFLCLMPFSDKIYSLRLEDNNTLKASTHSNFTLTIKFNKLIISDDYKLEGLPEKIGKTSYDNSVIDYFTIDRRVRLPDIIKKRQRVIKRIINTKKRVPKDNDRKWLVINSILTDEELNDLEFSGSYVRLRLIRMYAPEITTFNHIRRETYSLGKNLYDLPDNMRVLTETLKEINQPSDTPLIEGLIWKNLIGTA